MFEMLRFFMQKIRKKGRKNLNRAAAAEAANKVAKIRTDTRFAERYSAGDDVASITFVFSSE